MLNGWGKAKHQKEFSESWEHAVPVEKMKQMLHHEYSKAVLLLGKDDKKFTESIIAIEKEITKLYPKALALLAGPQKGEAHKVRPSLETCGVDSFSTLKKFKKNVDTLPPMGILLLE